MILQLNPSLPVTTPKGPAIAHFLIDSGLENDLQWVCFQDGSGECWTWSNRDIRAQKNITAGRHYISPFYEPEDAKLPDSKEQEWPEHECSEWSFNEECRTPECTWCGKPLKEIL